MILSMFAVASADTEYEYGTVHGITWTIGGKADPANETAVQREVERNERYLKATGNTIVGETFSYDYQAVGAMFEGGQLPTLFSIAATEPVKLIKNGWGRDISAQVEAVGIDLSAFNQAILDTYKDEEGHLYGLPYSAYALSILCNGQVFIDAGLVNEDGSPKLPTTWDEVLEDGKIIHDKLGVGGFALTACDNQGGWNFTNVAWNYGADLVVMNDDGTYTAQVNSPEAVAAMTLYKDLALSGGLFGDPTVDTRPNCISHLKAGNAAMCFGASDQPAKMSSTLDDGMDPTMVYEIAIPAGPDGIAKNLTGGSGYWFSPDATDEEVIAALEFLIYDQGRWTNEVTDEIKDRWVQGWKDNLAINVINLPGFPVYESEAIRQQNEMMKDYQTNIDFDKQFAKFYEDVQKAGALQTEEEGDTQNLYRELTSVIQAIVTDPENADVQALMDVCQENVQLLLDDFVAG
jgi:ABC-type glycerol-3-phosphate transport system substrate-binding protein